MRAGARIPMMLVVVLAALAAFAGVVVADAIPAPPACPQWQMVRWRGRRHSGAECVPRACRSNRQCGPGSRCGTRHACFARRERWENGGGPFRDRDGDGVHDGRRRVVETVEVGPCDERRRCDEGRCRPVRECANPAAIGPM